MWEPYENRIGRRPDFRVRYKLIPTEEGGRVQPPFQGYRSDFHYEGEDIAKDGIYMIWPEFLNSDGSVMREDDRFVPESGEANMWIIMYEKMKELHKFKATIGRKGWFMEGSRKVAEATIIELIGLANDDES